MPLPAPEVVMVSEDAVVLLAMIELMVSVLVVPEVLFRRINSPPALAAVSVPEPALVPMVKALAPETARTAPVLSVLLAASMVVAPPVVDCNRVLMVVVVLPSVMLPEAPPVMMRTLLLLPSVIVPPSRFTSV